MIIVDFSATGQCGMEVAIVLLLTVALSVATPLRQTHRSEQNCVEFKSVLETQPRFMVMKYEVFSGGLTGQMLISYWTLLGLQG